MNGIHRLPLLGWAVLSWALVSGCATGSASLEPVREEAVEVMRPPAAEELSHFVLVLQEGMDGRVTHAWRRAEQFDLSTYKRPSRTRGTEGEVVFASMRPRDCHAEYDEFSAMNEAVGWLTDNRQALLAGSMVVIAGVVFVTVSGGAGLLVLVPAVLLSDADFGVEPHALVAIQ